MADQKGGYVAPDNKGEISLEEQMRQASRRRHEAMGIPYPGDKPTNVGEVVERRDQLLGGKSNSLMVTGDFNDKKTGVDVSKYEGLEFKDGNFQMPKPLLDAAKLMAQELVTLAQKRGIDLSQSPEWKDAGLLTNDGKINVDSLSAYLLAKSIGNNTESFIDSPFSANRKDSLTAIFDNKITTEDYKGDPKLVFEMARQIMGDNGMRNVVGGATNTTQADAQFVQNNASKTTDPVQAKC